MKNNHGFIDFFLILTLGFVAFVGIGYLMLKNAKVEDFTTTVNDNSNHVRMINNFENKIADYSFKYSGNERVVSVGGFEGLPEVSDAVMVVDSKDENIGLLNILLQAPPVERYFKNGLDALDEIVGYWSSSTSQFFNPELNEVVGPVLMPVKTQDSNVTTQSYRYEINWVNDPKSTSGGTGSIVWIFIPVKANWQIDPDRLGQLDEKYTFIWLSYDKEDEVRVMPILNTLQLAI